MLLEGYSVVFSKAVAYRYSSASVHEDGRKPMRVWASGVHSTSLKAKTGCRRHFTCLIHYNIDRHRIQSVHAEAEFTFGIAFNPYINVNAEKIGKKRLF